jgi:branched-chain amino acid aminotransferase
MPPPLAYLNGEFLLLTELRLPVWDYAVVQGATVTDMVRTFAGEPFRLEQHLERFAASRRALGIELPESDSRLAALVRELIARTYPLLPEGSDCGMLLFATPGPYRPYAASIALGGDPPMPADALPPPGDGPAPLAAPPIDARPTLCIHPFPLAFAKHHYWYMNGAAAAVPQVRQVPAASLPPSIKYRSRLHWYLAEREARQIDPGAVALLLDEYGCLTETASGNLFIVRDGQLLTPRVETTLPGISQAYVSELIRAAGMTVVRADLTPEYVLEAEEAFLTSTTYCIAPLTWLDGVPIANGRPGPMFRNLIARWSEAVGVDILAQAERFSELPLSL